MNRSSPIIVLYDGIENSVFISQLLMPLLQQNRHVTHIYSYQPAIPSAATRQAIQAVSPLISFDPAEQKLITIHCIVRSRFWGVWSLQSLSADLQSRLLSFPSYTIRARGALAAIIARNGADQSRCTEFVIQARGLLAEEYRYTHASGNLRIGWWHRLRAWRYERAEKAGYQLHSSIPTIIEAVSPALKQYLIDTYQVPEESIIIAADDIPSAISVEKRKAWRTATRIKLAIPEKSLVYCYSGSAHAWQCPAETVALFAQEYEKNREAVLLILTTDPAPFLRLACMHGLPASAYRIHRAHPAQLMEYLAAADIGFLLREPHIINWVSRPTKLLEYQAAGLAVLHNGTVHAALHVPSMPAQILQKADSVEKTCS